MQLVFAPIGQRLFMCSLFAALSTGPLALIALAYDEIGVGNALWLAGLAAVLGFAAVRSFFCKVVLNVDGVCVQAIFWTRRYTWSQVIKFDTLSIRNGFTDVASPFLFVGHGGELEQIVMLPLLRPIALGFESRRRHWDAQIAAFEEFRGSRQ
jgi:hypothetical protein